jgi:predicted DNA-binding transcriptional regulator YafY
MSDTLMRQWELLRAIPRAPRKIDVATLMVRLRESGYRITRRSLQRDLNLLSGVFPLQSDTRTIPYGWSWAAEAPTFDLPAMDGPSALTMCIVELFAQTLLPPTVRQTLAPHFARAQAVLEAHPNNALRHWVDCVRVVPREMPLMAPKFNDAAVRTVYEGLLDNRRIKVVYAPRSADEGGERQYEVNPLGLVVRGSLSYLVCTFWDYQDIRQLALHRISSAEITDTPVRKPTEFDLDEYIEVGEFEYPVGPIVHLQVRFDRAAAAHLYETPLSADQIIEDSGADHVLVRATVRDTARLEWWLLAFGPSLTVVAPDGIRQRIVNAVRASVTNYSELLLPEK